MGLQTVSGVLLAVGTSLANHADCCCDEFTCGDDLQIAASGIANDDCTTCSNYNTTGTGVSSSSGFSGSPCGQALTDICGVIVSTYSGGDSCYNFGHSTGVHYVFITGVNSGTYYAFLVMHKGGEPFGQDFHGWKKTSGSPFTFPITFTFSDYYATCEIEASLRYCDFSSASFTVSVV